ncbi:MAG: hypothetical protein LIO87_10515, partial [Eubacterium sp.]|nr:hypothetical protein [Eubacterium sp.]
IEYVMTAAGTFQFASDIFGICKKERNLGLFRVSESALIGNGRCIIYCSHFLFTFICFHGMHSPYYFL